MAPHTSNQNMTTDTARFEHRYPMFIRNLNNV